MAALREMPRAGRQLLGTISWWKPCATNFQRCASTEAAAPTPEIPDIEQDSGLATPIVTREGVKLTDPRKRASRRNYELPHERYRYRPPKYDRGPLHPVQPPPSSDPVARNYSPGPFNLPRLKQTYHSTITSDILTLTYQHIPPGTPPSPERVRLREWDDSSPYMKNRPKRGPRGRGVLYPIEKDLNWRNLPEVKAVHLSMFIPQAKKNPDHLIVARSVLQTITGVRPTISTTRKSVAQWGIVKGDRTVVKVSVYGDQAYEFLDKIIHLVFPKIKNWKGVKGSAGDHTGGISWGFEPQHVQHFPEVEANYSLYPSKMISGCRFNLETTAKSNRHTRLLCMGLGIPFDGELVD
ncbi:54S ribosomal protein L7 [Annulohypoxylon truncatum]|uniref:54S ribosomal protein L7 n=1 Tax=Annulohypoxylon truncatum TaxID=327061 RepID=UPI0020088CE2|nr:54S ribosomal protein L7 [Annulohypoxylon truncatum]KAI1214868.1 54S ribosomal protein L7 [Annulohypoxylon truncatum]